MVRIFLYLLMTCRACQKGNVPQDVSRHDDVGLAGLTRREYVDTIVQPRAQAVEADGTGPRGPLHVSQLCGLDDLATDAGVPCREGGGGSSHRREIMTKVYD